MRIPVFVGRERELAELHRMLGRTAGGCATVAGEAGIGKSLLVQTLLAELGTAALVGAATEPPAPALRPLVEIAVGSLGLGADPQAPALRVHRRALAALLPGLLPEDPETGPIHPVVLADALRRLLDTLPRARWPVLVVEDLHWADADSLAAIEVLVERTASDAGTMLLTVRPEGPAWDRMLRLAQRRVAPLVELEALDGAGVLAMLAARLGCSADAVPPDLLTVVAPAEGRPLWIDEIVATVRGNGSLCRREDGWRLTEPGRVVPRTLSATVVRRLDGLGEARRGLECAALMGADVDPSVIAVALGRPTEAGDALLRAGLEAGLLVHGPDGDIRFRHELLRTAVADAMSREQRRATARLLFDAIEPVSPDRMDLAALLALHAGRTREATEALLATARRDLARGLPDTAARTLQRARDVAPAPLWLEVRELRVLALALAGDADGALADAGPVDAELSELPDTGDRRRRLGEAVVRATAAQGRWPEADGLVTALRARFPEAAPTAALAALIALENVRFDEAEKLAHAALVADGEPAARCEAMEVLGRLARRHDLAAAELWFRRAVAAAKDGGLAMWRARALHEQATIAQIRTYDLEPMRQARRAAVDAAAPGLVATVDFQIAAVHGVRFEPDLAIGHARLMLDSARRLGAHRQAA